MFIKLNQSASNRAMDNHFSNFGQQQWEGLKFIGNDGREYKRVAEDWSTNWKTTMFLVFIYFLNLHLSVYTAIYIEYDSEHLFPVWKWCQVYGHFRTFHVHQSWVIQHVVQYVWSDNMIFSIDVLYVLYVWLDNKIHEVQCTDAS